MLAFLGLRAVSRQSTANHLVNRFLSKTRHSFSCRYTYIYVRTKNTPPPPPQHLNTHPGSAVMHDNDTYAMPSLVPPQLLTAPSLEPRVAISKSSFYYLHHHPSSSSSIIHQSSSTTFIYLISVTRTTDCFSPFFFLWWPCCEVASLFFPNAQNIPHVVWQCLRNCKFGLCAPGWYGT